MDIRTAEEIREIMNKRDDYLERLTYIQQAESVRISTSDSNHMDFNRAYADGDELLRIMEEGYQRIIKDLEEQIHKMFSAPTPYLD